MNARELLQSAQAAERAGDLAQAAALLEHAARVYEETGHPARAAQMRRHVARLRVPGGPGAPPVPSSAPGADSSGTLASGPAATDRWPGLGAPEGEALPGAGVLVERAPVLADPAVEAWCSFCCRPAREVGRLVAGPAHAFVCRACVALAARLLDGDVS